MRRRRGSRVYDAPVGFPLEVYIISANNGSGSVAITGYDSCDPGDTCSYFIAGRSFMPQQAMLTAVPDSGSTFEDWTGDCTGTTPMFTLMADLNERKACTATFAKTGGSGTTYTTVARPEGIAAFHVGPSRPAGVPLLTATGLSNGTYVAVARGDTARGLDLVKLDDGTRRTNEFIDVSPAYGVTAYQGATSPLWAVFGNGGVLTAGWNNTLMDFGGAALGPATNTTQVSLGDFDDDGISEKTITTSSSGTIAVSPVTGGGSVLIDATAYNGTAATPVSAQFGRNADEVLIVLVDGRVFFGPVAGAVGRLTLVGSAGTSPRLAQCAGTTTRTCVIADYGGDRIHVVEIDGTGPHLTANQPTGDAPIDPAIMMDGTVARIAVTGSGDNTLEVLTYDPATDAISVTVRRAVVTGCTGPNHVILAKIGTELSA